MVAVLFDQRVMPCWARKEVVKMRKRKCGIGAGSGNTDPLGIPNGDGVNSSWEIPGGCVSNAGRPGI